MGNSNRYQPSQMSILKTLKNSSHTPQKHMAHPYKKCLDYSSSQVNSVFTLNNVLNISKEVLFKVLI